MRIARLIIVSFFIAATFFAGQTAQASSEAAPSQPVSIAAKIGCVDFTQAINMVGDGASAKVRLTSELKKRQSELDREQRKLSAIRDEIERKRVFLSPDALDDEEASYRKRLFDLQRRFSDLKDEMDSKQMEMTQNILVQLKDIVNHLGADEGFDLILERSQDVVLYSPNALDLTNRVIKIYNDKHKTSRR